MPQWWFDNRVANLGLSCHVLFRILRQYPDCTNNFGLLLDTIPLGKGRWPQPFRAAYFPAWNESSLLSVGWIKLWNLASRQRACKHYKNDRNKLANRTFLR